VISGHIAIAIYYNLPSRLTYVLLQYLTFPLGFGTRIMFRLRGMLTEFNHPRPSLSKIDLIYLLKKIKILSGDIVSLISTILVGTLRSVIFHLLLILAFVLS
jgi:hypothetical protein